MMTDKNRIENAIHHIQTASDIDPWAMEIAVEAMKKELPQLPKFVEEDRYVKGHYATYTYCPSCKYEIVTRDSHCIVCGQAIDWEGWK